MSDIYADDGCREWGNSATPARRTYQFLVVADAVPDVLLRVASQLLLTNTIPETFVLTQTAGECSIETRLTKISAEMAGSVRRKLLQLIIVRSVICEEI